MDISIIIVSYNVKYYLEQCLHSVIRAAQVGKLSWEVFVVDNASQDGSIEHLKQCFPTASYPMIHNIANARNVGFSRANNQAVELAKGKYILFLNPDTILAETTLSEAVTFANQHENLGAIGVKMLNDCGIFAKESRRSMPTPWVSFCRMSGLTTLFPKSKTFGRYYASYLDKTQSHEIEILSGAFMFTSSTAIKQCGAFDEDFFMYGEDIDLSYRLLKSGFTNYYIPSNILHYKGESTHKNSYRYTHVFYEAMLIFFRKHYGHLSWIFTFPIKCAIIFRAALTIIKQQISNIQPNFEDKLHFAFVGSRKNFDDATNVAKKWQIGIHYAGENLSQTLSLGTLPKETTHLLIDTTAISYEDTLNSFEKSAHQQVMAFYYPQQFRIVTGTEIYHL